MLLTVDLGNTSLKLGLFEKDEQLSFLCIDGICDNYRSAFLSFIYKFNICKNALISPNKCKRKYVFVLSLFFISVLLNVKFIYSIYCSIIL